MQQIRNFNEDFNSILNLYPERIACEVINGEELIVTYNDLDKLIKKTLSLFSEFKINNNAIICSILPNSIESIILFLSCMKGGYQYAPIHSNSTLSEVKEWVEFLNPEYIFYGNYFDEDIVNFLETSKINCCNFSLDLIENIDTKIKNKVPTNSGKLYIFSSGTTGKQKAIIHDINKLWSSGYYFSRLHKLDFNSDFKIWNYLSHAYLGGLFNLCLIPFSIGGTIVIDDNFTGKNFLSFWQTIERCNINALWLVPSIVKGLVSIGERIKRKNKNVFNRINIAFLGTAPIDKELKNQFLNIFNIRPLENFALSETTFISSEFKFGENDNISKSSGKILDYVDIKFKKIDSEIEGYKLLVKTPFLMEGYLTQDQTIALPKDKEGFLDTGDIGYLNNNNDLVITGREKEIIKKGGYLISLREIEIITEKYPGIIESAAVKVDHKFYGESYKLFIKFNQNLEKVNINQIRDFIYDNLAKYKWPEEIEFIEEFPKTISGKIIKKGLI